MIESPSFPIQDAPHVRSWTLGPWFHVTLGTLLVATGLVVFAARFSLPTDGWDVGSSDCAGLTYLENILGAPSGVQGGNCLLLIEGVHLHDARESLDLEELWMVGNRVEVSVLGGFTKPTYLTITQWTPKAWLGWFVRHPTTHTAALLTLVVGALILARRPRSQVAQALWLLAAAMAAQSTLTLLGGSSRGLSPAMPGWVSALFGFLLLATIWVLLPGTLLWLALLYPTPVRAVQRRPWLAWSAYLPGVLLLGYQLFLDRMWGSYRVLESNDPTNILFMLPFLGFILIWLLPVVVFGERAYRRTPGPDRPRAVGAFLVVMAGVALASLIILAEFWGSNVAVYTRMRTLSTLGIPLIVVALGVMMLRSRQTPALASEPYTPGRP